MVAESRKTYALTGAGGFLGWHVKVAIHSMGCEFLEIPLGERFDTVDAARALSSADGLIHLAGVNRGTDDAVASGNRLFAAQLRSALEQTDVPPASVAYANSTQSQNGSIYGQAKVEASETLAAAAVQTGAEFRDVLLPNLFGEHGRPFYNSVIATFCHQLATGAGEPAVQEDRDLTLLHAQDAADWLTGEREDVVDVLRQASVSELLARLKSMSDTYGVGDVPDLSTPFARDLFNTYRSYTPVGTVPLRGGSDQRGTFVEMARSWGGTGQSSFSTTVPGVTRGNHYHRRKVERFVVVAGRAEMQMRRLFTQDVIRITADNEPVAVDQLTGWTHNLINVGEETLYTLFWTNDIFDPANPDTFMESV